MAPPAADEPQEDSSQNSSSETIEVTVLMPCLNESETVEICIRKALRFLATAGIKGEVLIADNGSADNSIELAEAAGARVVRVPERGYGAALISGIKNAYGTFVIMGDADDSYDFEHLELFVAELRNGHDLVMGNRFKGGVKKGAMPALHRYLGNPGLTGLGRLLFPTSMRDFHCGLRGFRRQVMVDLDLRSTGMEFASEMVVKSVLNDLSITEVPTTLSPDGRSHAPHLNSWRDGWRHVRFLLLHSPKWLFLYPGLALSILGLAAVIACLIGILGLSGNSGTLLVAAGAFVCGLQLIAMAILADKFLWTGDILPKASRLTRFFDSVPQEAGIFIGAFLVIAGFIASVLFIGSGGAPALASRAPTENMGAIIASVTIFIIGMQMTFFSFFLGLLKLKDK